MHELSLAASLIEQSEEVAREAGAKSIRSITVGVGELSGVEPEALEFCFSSVAEESMASQAALIIQRLPVKIKCQECQAECEVKEPIMICRNCGGTAIEILAGMDFLLLEVEVE